MGGLGSQVERPQYPKSSTCLLYRVEQSQDCVQLNREAGLLHTAEQGGGVSLSWQVQSLEGSSLQLRTSRETSVMAGLYYTYWQRWPMNQKERVCHFPLSLVSERLCCSSVGLKRETLGSLTWQAPVNTYIHSCVLCSQTLGSRALSDRVLAAQC